jgi:LacI family transcriptional regulator
MSKPYPPTIEDVARKARVSIATVSRVINGTAPVHGETAQRVNAAIASLRYVPRTTARGLASRKTNTVGLILPEIGGWFFPSMLRGIETAAREAGYDLLIRTTDNSDTRKVSRWVLGMHNTDGLIVFTKSIGHEELAHLRSHSFPVVLLHQTPPESLDIPVVTIENKSGAQKLVDHLIEVHHCRRIVFLQGPESHEDSEWRELGYLESLEAHNIPFDSSLVAAGEFDASVAAASISQLLIDGVDFDAVFCGDDDAAIGVLTALERAGRLVPDEVAVVGFDDVPIARFLSPSLTTVRAPTEQVGADAVRQLIRLIRDERTDPLILLPTELVIRQSCGCHSTKGGDFSR